MPNPIRSPRARRSAACSRRSSPSCKAAAFPRAAAPAVLDDVYDTDAADVAHCLDAIRSGAPVVLVSGAAGTGKTRLIRHLVESAPDADLQAIAAPTGIAAINAGGSTLNSMFRLPLHVIGPKEDFGKSARNPLLRGMARLVVDEASMARADRMDAVDACLRAARRSDAPFGGVQIVMVGDFHQLPPVVTREEKPILDAIGYETPYAFSARAFKKTGILRADLTTIHRQSDRAFADLLTCVRTGEDIDRVLGILNGTCSGAHRSGRDPITVTSYRNDAETRNEERLSALPGPESAFAAARTGTAAGRSGDFPAPDLLRLRVGARVMAVKNDSEKRWFNGALGTVASIEPDRRGRGGRVLVLFDRTGVVEAVERETWDLVSQGWDAASGTVSRSVVGTFEQFPLALAWAVTIHKSQGLSLDDVRIDTGGRGAFERGQAYVGLSRVRTLDGLSFAKDLSAREILVDPAILAFERKGSIAPEAGAWIQAAGRRRASAA